MYAELRISIIHHMESIIWTATQEPITWGASTITTTKKKRKSLNDDDGPYELYNPMIYSTGTEIHFTCGIDEISIELLIKKFTIIINENEDVLVNDTLEIRYIVDSPGGCVKSILKFVDYIDMVKKKYPNIVFISIATGLIASAGTIMCIVADKRLMTKHTTAMIHELSAGRSGVYSHLKSYSENLGRLHNKLTSIYVSKTGQSKSEMEALLLKETWYDAESYKAGNFIDEII